MGHDRQHNERVLSDLRRSIGLAVLANTELDAIDKYIIDDAPIDDEQKSAMWLYAEVLIDRRSR